MDIENRVRRALRQGAAELHLSGAGPQVARERAAQRGRRRRLALSGSTAAIVLVAGVLGVSTLIEPRLLVTLDSPDDRAEEVVVPSAGPVDFSWRRAESLLQWPIDLVAAGDGSQYALSTAPGTRSDDYPEGAAPQAVYRSTDGAGWDTTELDADLQIVDLAERSGSLYALSTAPAVNGTGNGRFGISHDGGETWERMDLPSQATTPEVEAELAGPTVRGWMAVSDVAIVATVETVHWIDRSAFEPDAQRDDRHWNETEDGMALVERSVDLDCLDAPVPEGSDEPEARAACEEEEIVRTVGWEELGVPGREDLVLQETFVSTDGETWERVAPEASVYGRVTDLVGLPDGFVATIDRSEGEEVRTEMMRSTDGVTWSPISEPVPAQAGLGSTGGQLVAVGLVPSGADPERLTSVVSTSDDLGRSWSSTDLAEVVGADIAADQVDVWPDNVGIGPLGVAVLLSEEPADPPPGPPIGTVGRADLLYSPDGQEWSITPMAEITGDPNMAASWIAVGRDTITLHAAAITDSPRPAEVADQAFVGTPER